MVAKYFPAATFTEYGAEVPGWTAHCSPTTNGFNDGNVSTPSPTVTPDDDCAPVPAAGTPAAAQSPALYMDVGVGLGETLKTYYGVHPYPDTPFNAFRQAANRLRSGVLGAAATNQSIEMIPYLAYKSYAASRTNASDDYEELILHAGLTGVDRCVGVKRIFLLDVAFTMSLCFLISCSSLYREHRNTSSLYREHTNTNMKHLQPLSTCKENATCCIRVFTRIHTHRHTHTHTHTLSLMLMVVIIASAPSAGS